MPGESERAPVAPQPAQIVAAAQGAGEPSIMDLANSLQEKLASGVPAVQVASAATENNPSETVGQTAWESAALASAPTPTPTSAAESQGKPSASTFFLDQRGIGEVRAIIAQTPGDMPANTAGELAKSGGLPALNLVRNDWSQVNFCWDATAMAHRPLYFEEINLERYGYTTRCPYIVQPVVSGARFFATVPILPYRMVAEPWCEQVYTLGQYRPGSCVPNQWNMLPLSVTGASAEAAVASGIVFAVP
jgi:hypothetical protein